MDQTERKVLGDIFDRTIRSLNGLPDVISTKATTVRSLLSVLELSQTFIVQTYRQCDALTNESRSKAAKANAMDREARGIRQGSRKAGFEYRAFYLIHIWGGWNQSHNNLITSFSHSPSPT